MLRSRDSGTGFGGNGQGKSGAAKVMREFLLILVEIVVGR